MDKKLIYILFFVGLLNIVFIYALQYYPVVVSDYNDVDNPYASLAADNVHTRFEKTNTVTECPIGFTKIGSVCTHYMANIRSWEILNYTNTVNYISNLSVKIMNNNTGCVGNGCNKPTGVAVFVKNDTYFSSSWVHVLTCYVNTGYTKLCLNDSMSANAIKQILVGQINISTARPDLLVDWVRVET